MRIFTEIPILSFPPNLESSPKEPDLNVFHPKWLNQHVEFLKQQFLLVKRLYAMVI